MYFAANEDGRIWYASETAGQSGEFWAETPQELDLARIGDWVRDGESSIRYEPVVEPITAQELIMAMVESVTIPERPAEKLGYDLAWHYDASTHSVVWTFEPNGDAQGTADSPFTYAAGVALVPNAYYMHDGTRYVFVDAHQRTATDWATDSVDMEEF